MNAQTQAIRQQQPPQHACFGVIFFFFEPSNEDPKEPVPVATLPCLSTKNLYQKVMTSDVISSAAACEMMLA
jgi:hypothetical protein